MTLIINSRTFVLASAAVVCLLIVSQFGQAAKPEPQAQVSATSLVSKSLPAQTRTRQSRSLSDMFEKVKSKLFGSRKQGQVAAVNQQMQGSASSNVAAMQRQPWNDINSFNQQYSPMVGYQGWPQASAASGNQFMQQPYGSMSSYMPQAGSAGAFPQAPSSQAGILSMDSQQQQQQPLGGIASAVGSSPSETGGLLASASQLFTRFISPNSGPSGSNVQPVNQQQASQVSPQQQQQQNQYNEFASMLDSMVAQTGVSSQRQPSQYQSAIQQQQQMPQAFQSAQVGDNDMSGSSNIQSYLPASSSGVSQPQAGPKSSMVSLAEQLAPGAAFNKLVSFPFSLTNNEDPTKEGKYKLHIPFLNQHVKRSDQQAAAAASSAAISHQQQQQRLAQQYLNSLINQQYLAVANPQAQQQQQLMSQPSQVVASIASPQFQQSLTSGASAASQSASQPVSSLTASQTAAAAPAASSNSASSLLSAASNPIATSSQVINSSNPNGRQSWSVSDSQSSAASSSKLIPMSSSSSLQSLPASESANQS